MDAKFGTMESIIDWGFNPRARDGREFLLGMALYNMMFQSTRP